MRRMIAKLVLAAGLSGCAVHPHGMIVLPPVAVAPAHTHEAPRPVMPRPWGWDYRPHHGPGWGHRRW